MKQKRGFTIVELLIVVVVIAILAAITIVAYNGITGQAKRAGVDSSLATAKKKVELFAVENSDTYPTSLSQAGIQGSDKENQTTYRYTANNTTSPKSYCITAINGTNRSYTTNTSATPQSGSCPGHDNDSNYITNLITNPSFEGSVDGVDIIAGSLSGVIIDRAQECAYSGDYGLRISISPSAPSFVVGVGSLSDDYRGVGQYAARAMVYSANATGNSVRFGIWNDGNGSTGSLGLVGQWARLAGVLNGVEARHLYVALEFWRESMGSGGATVCIDSLLSTRGVGGLTASFSKGDGNSPSWIWNGTPHGSTSTGPMN